MELNTRVKREQGRPAYLLSGPLLSFPESSVPAPKLVGRCGKDLE
jgi:hypothetical protein